MGWPSRHERSRSRGLECSPERPERPPGRDAKQLASKTTRRASTPARGGHAAGSCTPRRTLCIGAGARKRKAPRSVERPNPKCRKSSDQDLGPASESRELHLKRHDGGRRTCQRCRYYLFGDGWAASYGSFEAPSGPRARVVWLGERPARWGGVWGLGCSVCADLDRRRRQSEEPTAVGPGACASTSTSRGRGHHKRCSTKWARYEVRAEALQSEHVRVHAQSDVHKLAMAAHIKPDEPVRIALQRTLEDDQLLAGAVPQPADWLRTWRLCQNPASWESAAQSAQTEHFIAQIRHRSVQARSFKAMVSCMAEVLRTRKRQWLREASCIFFGFDDKNGRKLLRFKVDTPTAPTCFDAVTSGDPTLLPYGARIATVGCIPVGRSCSPEDFDRDYAERTAEHVLQLIARLCTPAGDVRDETLYQAALRKTRGLVVDGALLKTAQILIAKGMSNVVLVMRDPSHIIRISCRDPLHDGALFKEQHDR